MRTTTAVLLSVVLATAAAGPLDPVKSLIEGFYTAYSGQDFSAPACLSADQQNDIVIAAEAIVADFEDEHSFAMLYSHAYELINDLEGVESSCGLTALVNHLVGFVESEGIAAFVETVEKDEVVLTGFALQLFQQLLQHEWQAAGATLGEAVAVVIPPEINFAYSLHGVNFFQKLDNFTAGLFMGFASQPKKPVPCFSTYNNTSLFFQNASSTINGCIHLYMDDCAEVRDLVPDAIIQVQSLVLSCKLQDLWESLKGLADPTYWSTIVVTYYWNMTVITGFFNDMLQSYMLKNWKQMGVDVGSIIRILFNFKLN